MALDFGAIWLQDLQDSSDEEEGEGNEYDVTDKFLVADGDADEDEDAEADGAEGTAKRKKKRRRRRESDEELDEEDYELIVGRPSCPLPLLSSVGTAAWADNLFCGPAHPLAHMAHQPWQAHTC